MTLALSGGVGRCGHWFCREPFNTPRIALPPHARALVTTPYPVAGSIIFRMPTAPAYLQPTFRFLSCPAVTMPAHFLRALQVHPAEDQWPPKASQSRAAAFGDPGPEAQHQRRAHPQRHGDRHQHGCPRFAQLIARLRAKPRDNQVAPHHHSGQGSGSAVL